MLRSVLIIGALVASFTVASDAHAQIRYSGSYAREVNYLLNRVSGWSTPSCASCNDFVTPSIRVNSNSQRDMYVAAAVTAAWAAESYARLGLADQAEQTAAIMHEQLENADALCGGSVTIENGSAGPQTLNIWPCPNPFR